MPYARCWAPWNISFGQSREDRRFIQARYRQLGLGVFVYLLKDHINGYNPVTVINICLVLLDMSFIVCRLSLFFQ